MKQHRLIVLHGRKAGETVTVRDWIDPTRLYNPTIPAGRIVYLWAAVLFPTTIFYFGWGFVSLALMFMGYDYGHELAATVVFIVESLVQFVTNPLAAIRRFRDLNEPWWIVLALFLPLVGSLIALILGVALVFVPRATKKSPQATAKP